MLLFFEAAKAEDVSPWSTTLIASEDWVTTKKNQKCIQGEIIASETGTRFVHIISEFSVNPRLCDYRNFRCVRTTSEDSGSSMLPTLYY